MQHSCNTLLQISTVSKFLLAIANLPINAKSQLLSIENWYLTVKGAEEQSWLANNYTSTMSSYTNSLINYNTSNIPDGTSMPKRQRACLSSNSMKYSTLTLTLTVTSTSDVIVILQVVQGTKFCHIWPSSHSLQNLISSSLGSGTPITALYKSIIIIFFIIIIIIIIIITKVCWKFVQ